ncbi:tRNA(His) guanylyltransferase [Histoplasma capsulatum H143]|uniref:tRNA(His) guanylyltransferase n=1 Tax=Ajellomyces capsulatus (strain H143) TaxID=544712 RepID=C6HNU2_AJECH|nr:tRNA(His) guanylyltransferase [Histoplasma capsulatum H143]
MANSKYEYVKTFEQDDSLLPNTWIVVRIDGRGFHRFSDRYKFQKPNDERALNLMNTAACAVMRDLPDLIIAYGVSDEYRCGPPSTERRQLALINQLLAKFCFSPELSAIRAKIKLVTAIVSAFTAHYIFNWSSFFPSMQLEPGFLPSFDGRAVQYPSVKNLRDYMSWRQADCHINNLYNTTFWNMILQGGMSNTEAEKALQCNIQKPRNQYEIQPQIEKMPGGSKEVEYEVGEEVGEEGPPAEMTKSQIARMRKIQKKATIAVMHLDIIKDDFWDKRPWILSNKPGNLPGEG